MQFTAIHDIKCQFMPVVAIRCASFERLSSVSFVVVACRVDKFTPVKVTVTESSYQRLCGGNVGGERNVIHVTEAKQSSFSLKRRLLGICASEIEHKVYLVV